MEFRQTRQLLHLTQDQLADRVQTTRRSIIRYEDGSLRIPGWQSSFTRRVEGCDAISCKQSESIKSDISLELNPMGGLHLHPSP